MPTLHGGLALHLAEVVDLDAERGLELLAGGAEAVRATLSASVRRA